MNCQAIYALRRLAHIYKYDSVLQSVSSKGRHIQKIDFGLKKNLNSKILGLGCQWKNYVN